MKQTISVLVENQAGVLNRITGLFSRRAFNIDSLAVGVTDDPTISRITIIVDSGNSVVEQVEKQLNKLVEVIKAAIPAAARRTGGHPARKAFQALRIEVNHELDVLDRGLRAAIRWANTGGRICVISYHSLEDRIVKHVFSEMSQGCTCPPDLPVCVCGHVPIVNVRTRKPLVASDEEVATNPRSRSALMRVAVKLDVTGAGPSK